MRTTGCPEGKGVANQRNRRLRGGWFWKAGPVSGPCIQAERCNLVGMEIVTVVGARPQFIKAAPVSRALQRAGIAERLLHTGQHYDANLSAVFFGELGLPKPAHQLEAGSGTHGQQTGKMLVEIEAILLESRPDAVLVYGDTNSTLAGALAAAKLNLPVVHVEAGLRSFNAAMPEEINRVVTDHVSRLLFCPTEVACANLRREGVEEGVHLVGDVMLDAAKMFGELADREGGLDSGLSGAGKGLVLCTIHRSQNTDDPGRLQEIAKGLALVAEEWTVLFPIHPRTRERLERAGLLNLLGRVRVLDPFPFFTMVQALRRADVVVTDSGGVQKEAYFHGTPCLTVREETEWTETVAAGWNRLVAADAQAIVQAVNSARAGEGVIGDYGTGCSAEAIASVLREWWKSRAGR